MPFPPALEILAATWRARCECKPALLMKFGKDLEQYVSAGWEESYIDYKALKTVLKRLEGKGEKGGEGKEVQTQKREERRGGAPGWSTKARPMGNHIARYYTPRLHLDYMAIALIKSVRTVEIEAKVPPTPNLSIYPPSAAL